MRSCLRHGRREVARTKRVKVLGVLFPTRAFATQLAENSSAKAQSPTSAYGVGAARNG